MKEIYLKAATVGKIITKINSDQYQEAALDLVNIWTKTLSYQKVTIIFNQICTQLADDFTKRQKLINALWQENPEIALNMDADKIALDIKNNRPQEVIIKMLQKIRTDHGKETFASLCYQLNYKCDRNYINMLISTFSHEKCL